MPHAVRNAQGKIVALLSEASLGPSFPVSMDDPEVRNFLTGGETATPLTADIENAPVRALAASDLEIVRVTEDVIQLLIRKNIILFTDLPAAVQSKLLNREKLRNSMQPNVDNFLDDSELI